MQIAVTILSPLRLAGRTVEAGSTIKLDVGSAAAVVASGRGKLHDPADGAALDAYWAGENAKTMALVGRVPPERLRFRC